MFVTSNLKISDGSQITQFPKEPRVLLPSHIPHFPGRDKELKAYRKWDSLPFQLSKVQWYNGYLTQEPGEFPPCSEATVSSGAGMCLPGLYCEQ